ncbi:hypothetical protein P3T37_000858 [Kitasatospora sp. MAA4]|uniref:hypothetical protein n=1 Tax=Kitasatospora sp. MAA4 TaxID=3035093 RepID=UPI0024755B44|nr:hypothetical protein [Kitasatospora sp. MAA4]MDH6131489.1 hypothetical protein [Kitasatospora sp. MAA4]
MNLPGTKTAGLLTVVGLAVGVSLMLPATGAQSRPVPPGAAQQRQRPAPHVMDFAQGLSAPARRSAAVPQAGGAPVAATADGCDHAYGDINVCVPWTFPAAAGTAPGDGCRWLLAHGYPALAVHGRDRLGLDTDHDGTACDHGDAGAGG